MRISVVVSALRMGGVETVLKRLYRFFEDAGHQITFVETTARGGWADEFQDCGFRVVDALPEPTRSRVHHARRIARVLREYDALLLNDTPFAQAVLGLLPQQTVAIAVLHMLEPASFVKNALGNPTECDCVVAVNPALRDVLVEKHNVDEERVAAIPNGVEVPDAWPKSERAFDAGRPLRVVYAGRMEHKQKGVLFLPQIIAKSVARCQRKLVFDVAGDGPDLPELRRRCAALGDAPGVRFHGCLSHDKTLELLSRADVLLMPSRWEGLPMVLLEAMAAGVVPVATRLPNLEAAVLRDRENAYTATIDDVDGFVEALAAAGGRRDQLREMSRAAWQWTFRHFSSAAMARSYLDLIAQLRRRRSSNRCEPRSGKIDIPLLGDLPRLPLCLVRPCRKLLRIAGLWPKN